MQATAPAIAPVACRLCGKLPEIAITATQYQAAHAERDKPFCPLGTALFVAWSEDAAPAVEQWNAAMGIAALAA